ncbi:MAG: GNVR domain-containing protein, partial [Thiohalorhabdus sp.]
MSELQARPGTRFRLVKRPRHQVVGGLQDRLKASEEGESTGIIRVSMEGERPERIREVLDTVADLYLRQNVEHRSAQAEESLKFLEKQLPEMQTDLEAAEQRFSEFHQENQTLDLTVQTEKLLEQLVEVDSKVSQLQTKRAEEAKNFGPQHPRMQAIDAQVAQLREEKRELESRVSGLPGTQQEVFKLRRQVEVSTEVYTSMLNEAEELRVAKAGTVGNVRVVDYAAPPGSPVKPRKGLVGALSGVLGLFLGTGLVLVRWALRRGIEDPNELETGLGIPVYSVIPHSGLMEKEKRRRQRAGEPLPILVRDEPEGPPAEAFRSLRTSLQFGLMETDNNVVLVSGASPNAGKTFVLVNVAAVLAQGGRRPLVVDGDLRRGHLHEYLGGQRSPGLSEVLSGTATLDRVVRRCGDNAVDFL